MRGKNEPLVLLFVKVIINFHALRNIFSLFKEILFALIRCHPCIRSGEKTIYNKKYIHGLL